MPAKSKAQQRFMAMAEHNPTALYGPKPNMTHQQLHDFAATPTKGLPTHVKVSKPARELSPEHGKALALASHPHAQRLGKWLHPKKAR
jgi:hypothetical protein